MGDEQVVTAKAAETVERRIYKRFESDFPVVVHAGTGERIECRATNVSLAGMELRTDRRTVMQIAPKSEKTTPDQSPVVRMQLDIPSSDGTARTITADCRILVVRRVSEQEYYLHIRYEFFDGNGYDELENWVGRMLAAQDGKR